MFAGRNLSINSGNLQAASNSLYRLIILVNNSRFSLVRA